VFLYLAKERIISNSTFEEALAELKENYPGIDMVRGKRGFWRGIGKSI
jgi:hypothetical protein